MTEILAFTLAPHQDVYLAIEQNDGRVDLVEAQVCGPVLVDEHGAIGIALVDEDGIRFHPPIAEVYLRPEEAILAAGGTIGRVLPKRRRILKLGRYFDEQA